MFNGILKLRKPGNILLIFDILAIGLLMLYKNLGEDRRIAVMASLLIVLLYLSNILLRKITTGDNYIFMIVSMLVSIGAVMNFSIDPQVGLKQLIWTFLGIMVFYISYFLLKYINFWHKGLNFYLLLTLILFVSTLAFGKETY